MYSVVISSFLYSVVMPLGQRFGGFRPVRVPVNSGPFICGLLEPLKTSRVRI